MNKRGAGGKSRIIRQAVRGYVLIDASEISRNEINYRLTVAVVGIRFLRIGWVKCYPWPRPASRAVVPRHIPMGVVEVFKIKKRA